MDRSTKGEQSPWKKISCHYLTTLIAQDRERDFVIALYIDFAPIKLPVGFLSRMIDSTEINTKCLFTDSREQSQPLVSITFLVS